MRLFAGANQTVIEVLQENIWVHPSRWEAVKDLSIQIEAANGDVGTVNLVDFKQFICNDHGFKPIEESL